MNNSRSQEFGYLFLLALALLLGFIFIAPTSMTGFLGTHIGSLGFSLFGTMSYALPFVLLYFSVEGLIQRNQDRSKMRRLYVLLLFLICTVLIGVLNIDNQKMLVAASTEQGSASALKSIGVLWKAGNAPSLISTSNFWSSGLLGGMIAMSFLMIAGRLGAIIILLAVGIALLALILDTSISQMFNATAQGVRKTGGKLRDTLNIPDEESALKHGWTKISSRLLREETDFAAEESPRDYDYTDGDFQISAPNTKVEYLPAEVETASTSPVDIADLPPVDSDDYDFELQRLQRQYTKRNEVSSKWLQEHLSRQSPEYRKDYVPQYQLPEGSWRRKKITQLPFDMEGHPLMNRDFYDNLPGHRAEKREYSSATSAQRIGESDQSAALRSSEQYVAEPQDISGQHNPIQPGNSVESTTLGNSSRSTQTQSATGRNQVIPQRDLEDASSDRAKWQDRSDDNSTAAQALSSTMEMMKTQAKSKLSSKYVPPSLSFLVPEKAENIKQDPQRLQELGVTLEQTLRSFGVDAHVLSYTSGPTITRFEIAPGPGVKVSKILNLTDDIALALAATGVRMEAPIPGKSAIGIEIPNAETQPVLLSGLLASSKFRQAKGPLVAALGRDIQGSEILCDIGSMPHLLIAGATGSGKSVCINTILVSLLYRTSPADLKLLMIDPKVVELSIYNGIPHLLQPVVTDPKKAYGVLNWAVQEMTERYNKFAQSNVRDFNGYNDAIARGALGPEHTKLPKILIVIDELSDLMATSASEVENAISRLTAMARAAGIHLIIATQRPSVDVITGVIKANIPSRIAFAVASQVDSRTILDLQGAEKLLGRGDMLYFPQSYAKPLRGQGAFITDAEVERVVTYLKTSYAHEYDENVGRAIEQATTGSSVGTSSDDEIDDLLEEALKIVIEAKYASTSMLQRRLSIGYPRASRIIDQLHEFGYIGPFEGSKPRKVTITMAEYLARKESENVN